MQAGTQAKLDTSDEQAALAVEVEQSLPPLALPVLDHVRFIQDQVFPLLAPKHLCILHAHWTTDEVCLQTQQVKLPKLRKTVWHQCMCKCC